MFVLGVTSCPSGVAHTYMAAEALQKACQKKGFEVKVETQGQIGLENEITADDVARADVIVLTNNMPIKGEERFKGKPIVRIEIGKLIRQSDAILDAIVAKLNK